MLIGAFEVPRRPGNVRNLPVEARGGLNPLADLPCGPTVDLADPATGGVVCRAIGRIEKPGRFGVDRSVGIERELGAADRHHVGIAGRKFCGQRVAARIAICVVCGIRIRAAVSGRGEKGHAFSRQDPEDVMEVHEVGGRDAEFGPAEAHRHDIQVGNGAPVDGQLRQAGDNLDLAQVGDVVETDGRSGRHARGPLHVDRAFDPVVGS
jgi:hypothetical protein